MLCMGPRARGDRGWLTQVIVDTPQISLDIGVLEIFNLALDFVWRHWTELALDPCTGVMSRPIQNHEICYLKWRIALEKSILDEFY